MAEVALRDYLVEINTLIERNSLDTAIQHCRHILGVYPKYVEVYRLLGKALLEKEAYDAAADVFQRVLSVDPEDFVARVGLSIIAERHDQLDKAIYQMERAYDLVPHNDVIQGELRHLYARRDGDAPSRLTLTRGAVARMYAQGDLYAEAEHALRDLLHEQPDRLDLQVLLAEVLWRADRRVEAADWARRVLDRLPYCLNANLILGAILRAAGDGDSDQFLKRAQAVDPDNAHAVRLFGADSPLPLRAVEVARWEPPSYGELLSTDETEAAEQVPDWLRGISELSAPAELLEAPESAVNPPLPAGLHMPGAEPPRGEIPDWLQGLTVAPDEAPAEPGGEVPAWLSGLGTGPLADATGRRAETETPAAAPPHSAQDEEVPDWIKQLGTGTLTPPPDEPPAPSAETTPDWLKQLGTGLLEQEPAEQSVIPVEDDTPDWLKQLGATGRLQQVDTPHEDALPDWLGNLRSQPAQAAPPEADESSQTDSSFGASLAQSAGEAAAGAVGLAGVGLSALAHGRAGEEPAIEDAAHAEALTTDELANPLEEVTMAQPPNPIDSSSPSAMPSADDALAFLASLAAGKEDQLRAEAEQEGEARMAAIMGRKTEPPASAAPVPEPVVEPPAEEAVAAAQAAAILEGDISPDDALAFLARLSAGKEEQLRAEAEAEGEARMAAIMGRKTEPPPAELPVEAAAPFAAELPSGQAEPIEMATEPEVVVTEFEAAKAEPLELEPMEAAAEVAPGTDDWLAQLAAAGAPQSTPEEELPEWLRAMRPAETALAEPALPAAEFEPEAASAAEAERILAGLTESEAELPAAEEEPPAISAEEVPALGELPDWLRAMQPETPAVAAPDELPDWLRAMQPTVKAETPAPEPVASSESAPVEPELAMPLAAKVEAEAAPAPAAEIEPAPPEMATPINWWVQSAEDEDEAPLTELPAPLPVSTPSAARPRDTGRLAPSETRRATGPLPVAADVNIDPLLQQLQADKYNHGVRLELARAWWSMGNRDSALEEYGKLINPARVENLSDEELDEVMFADPGPLADDIVADLERIAEIDEQPAWLRLLGDMRMKTGNLAGALDAYRRALNHL
jgi:tetratricopeptide (TPR) repeat protein